MYTGFRVKHPLFVLDCKKTCIFLKDFRKIIKYQIWCKSVLLEQNRFIRTDRRTRQGQHLFFAILRMRLKIATFIIANSSSPRVSYPRHTRLYYKAHGHICNISGCFRNYTAIWAVGYSNYCCSAHVRPTKEPTITCVVLCPKNAGCQLCNTIVY
jgi:hypothetical protein